MLVNYWSFACRIAIPGVLLAGIGVRLWGSAADAPPAHTDPRQPPAVAASQPTAGHGLAKVHEPLALRLQPGMRFGLVRAVEDQIDERFPYGDVHIRRLLELAWVFDVLEVDDAGISRLKIRLQHAKFELDRPSTTVRYDSRKPDQLIPPHAQTIAKLVGRDFQATLSRTGEIMTIDGCQALIESLIDPADATTLQRRIEAGTKLRMQINEELLRDLVAPMFVRLPPSELDAGDGWTVGVDASGIIRMRSERTSAPAAGGPATARTFEVTGSLISVNTKPPPSSATGIPRITRELTGTEHGTLQLDPQTGLPMKLHLIAHAEGPSEMPGLKWTMKVATTTQLELEFLSNGQASVDNVQP